MKRVELLAPAGSLESLIAAVNAGCDAAYIGGSIFGARAFAENLEEEALLRAIDFMHIRGKKLYLTINTLLKTDEVEEKLYQYLDKYYRQGLDAVIVQDIGVMQFIHDNFEDLPIHASTQMTLTMAEGVKAFEELGVTRIVTARELTLKEIHRIRENTTLEIESFVHGALCYSYSGQCLMSSMIGGRSGNRGRCAQPCRMEYQFEFSKEKSYLLSPKDICTISIIPELIQAGIDSFKIEGRMKRYEYVAGVTTAYRKQIDKYYELLEDGYQEYLNSHQQELQEEIRKLKDLYNRGDFCTGYYKEQNKTALMAIKRAKHNGVYVGDVKKIKKNQATIELKEDIFAQDILEIRSKGKEIYEFTVKNNTNKNTNLVTNFKYGCDVAVGCEVYRTKNTTLLEQLSKDYYETNQKIKIDGVLTASVSQPVQLTIKQAEQIGQLKQTEELIQAGRLEQTEQPGQTEQQKQTEQLKQIEQSKMLPFIVTVSGAIVQEAKKQPIQKEKIEEQLRKTGETPFIFNQLQINLNGSVFLPVSSLNELRRNALEQFEREFANQFRRKRKILKETSNLSQNNLGLLKGLENLKDLECSKNLEDLKDLEQLQSLENLESLESSELEQLPFTFSVSVCNLEQFKIVLKTKGITDIYLDTTDCEIEDILLAIELIKSTKKQLFLLLPHIFRAETYDYYKKHQEIISDFNIAGYIIRNFEEYYFITKELKEFLKTKKINKQEELKKAKKIKKEKEIRLDYTMYVMNQEAKKFYYNHGINRFTAPVELNEQELAKLGIQGMELLIYGRIPLMVSAQCIRKNTSGCVKQKKNMYEKEKGENLSLVWLTDRVNKKIPVVNHCNHCYNSIYNPEIISLNGLKKAILELNPSSLRLSFTLETKKEVEKVLQEVYTEFADGILSKEFQTGYTKGHFRRGIR